MTNKIEAARRKKNHQTGTKLKEDEIEYPKNNQEIYMFF